MTKFGISMDETRPQILLLDLPPPTENTDFSSKVSYFLFFILRFKQIDFSVYL